MSTNLQIVNQKKKILAWYHTVDIHWKFILTFHNQSILKIKDILCCCYPLIFAFWLPDLKPFIFIFIVGMLLKSSFHRVCHKEIHDAKQGTNKTEGQSTIGKGQPMNKYVDMLLYKTFHLGKVQKFRIFQLQL